MADTGLEPINTIAKLLAQINTDLARTEAFALSMKQYVYGYYRLVVDKDLTDAEIDALILESKVSADPSTDPAQGL